MSHFGASHFAANHFAATHFLFEYDQEYVSAGYDLCQRCGREYRLSQLHREWTGLLVCRPCYDPRHKQDFVRGVPDSQGVRPGMRPEPEPYYLSTNEVSANDL